MPDTLSLPLNQLAIRRAADRLCALHGWAVLHEMMLANGRRADILALRPDGGFVCIEVKSGPRDFLLDAKWPDYRDYCDELYFAVDTEFPAELIPETTGLIVACTRDRNPDPAELIRPAPPPPPPPPRPRPLTHPFAMAAAPRLSLLEDPAITASLRAALRVE